MVNKVILVGRLGKDPEIKHMGNDNAVCNFSLATSESYKDRDGNRIDQTDWHNIVIWGKLAKVAEKYLKKGSMVYLDGKNRTRSYEDKQGVKRYVTEVICDKMKMLGDRSEHKPQAQEQNQYSDGLPF